MDLANEELALLIVVYYNALIGLKRNQEELSFADMISFQLCLL